MIGINEQYFVFYWRADEKDQYQISQPITIGELIDGGVELEFPDGDTLPLHDVDWSNDDLKMDFIPQRKIPPTKSSPLDIKGPDDEI